MPVCPSSHRDEMMTAKRAAFVLFVLIETIGALNLEKGFPLVLPKYRLHLEKIQSEIFSETFTALSGDVQVLEISQSDINHIEDRALCPHSVDELVLDSNSLPKLTRNSWGTCSTLKRLKLISNKLYNTSETLAIDGEVFSALSMLRVLHVENQKIEKLDVGSVMGSFLKVLTFLDVQILNLQKDFLDNLKFLEALTWKITHRNGTVNGRMLRNDEVEYMMLKLGREGFGLSRLVLNGHKNLSKFPWDSLKNSPHLRVLDLTGNSITDLDAEAVLEHAPNLSTLKLDWCSRKDLEHLRKMEGLSVSCVSS